LRGSQIGQKIKIKLCCKLKLNFGIPNFKMKNNVKSSKGNKNKKKEANQAKFNKYKI
jgi:hypothetical protein